MQDENVIEFRPRKYYLEKAEYYMERLEAFLLEPDAASKILLKALDHAPQELMQRIMLMLGSFAKEAAAMPFFQLMTDPLQADEIRRLAAIELSVLCGHLLNPGPLMEVLKKASQDPDAFSRANALFAMSWKGNNGAALILVDGLYDPDPEVQQAAVHGLANLGDDRVFNLLLDRLRHGGADQKRAILCNLWRFSNLKNEVTAVYRKCLTDPDSDLRWEALIAMDLVEPSEGWNSEEIEEWTTDYVRCLRDRDHRIRLLAIRRLGKSSTGKLSPHRSEIALLEQDPEPVIRQEARQLLSRLME